MKIITMRIFGRSNHYNIQFTCQENHSEAYLTEYLSFIVVKVQLLTVLLLLSIITVKPRFIVFVGGPEKKRWLRENDRCEAYIK
jgi:hypothetical protein